MSNQDAQAVISHLLPILTTYGLQILGAIAILAAGRIVASVVGNVTRRSLTRGKIDVSLVGLP